MPRSRPSKGTIRAPRVRVAGTVLLLARMESGRQLVGKLHQLSITGGLMHLEKPLDEGIKVEVVFHVGKSTVRGKARTLFPMWATQGYLQPFEFGDMPQDYRSLLENELQTLLKSSPANLGTQDNKAPEVFSKPCSLPSCE
jgi:hypothetical protein